MGKKNFCNPVNNPVNVPYRYQEFLESHHIEEALLPESMVMQLHGHVSRKPFIEGAWMDKHEGRYYLQYACTGAEYSVYNDGVYVGDSPAVIEK